MFDGYAGCLFSHITRQLETCTRVDVVWDRYISDSIKAAVKRRGKGKGIVHVGGKNKLPGYWRGFLSDEGNKQELFNFFPK